jgi:hypothetical protein
MPCHQDLAGLNNTAVVERVMDEFLEKRKANKDSPACLVIDGKITVLAVKINLEKSLDGLQQTNTTTHLS